MLALYCVILACSLAFSTVLTWAMRNIATRYGWASRSIFSHHIHSRPIPRVGGLAVFVSFFGLWATYASLSRYWHGASLDGDVLKLIVPGCCLFLTGLLDDLLGLSAKAKLFGQIVGGVCLYAGGIRILDNSFHTAPLWLGTGVSLVATVFLVVLITNSINLIDGLDGLAAGVAIFCLASVLIYSLFVGAASIAIASLILAGAVGGFLVFNFNPASIFLGDSGSLFLGMMLSGLVIGLSKRQESALVALMMPVFIFALPLADTTISILRRLLARRPLFQADRGHVHHMLLRLGLSQRAAVCVLYGMSAVAMLLSLVLLHPSPLLLGSVVAALPVLVLLCVRKLNYQEFAELSVIWRTVRDRRAASANGHASPSQRSRPSEPAVVRLGRLHSSSDLDIAVTDDAPPILSDVPAEEAIT